MPALLSQTDRMVDEHGNVFPPERYGYSAAEAAVYLENEWQRCDPPLTQTEKAADVQGVIDVLIRWRADILR